MEAEVPEILNSLHQGSRREQGPWHKNYNSKSRIIAYRWHSGKAVTPPFFEIANGKLIVVGGNHRLGLAIHYRANRLLKNRSDLQCEGRACFATVPAGEETVRAVKKNWRKAAISGFKSCKSERFKCLCKSK
ncbi:hypothetical protein [Asticcacaulis endophyticus]|uniref:hypothetical protein n=1 Tax=Asticcacaulis endophyticus TaxID=1395890 RepID=UPI001677C566|nr:hypothetical protein [Asticcacaulis endophyticus]